MPSSTTKDFPEGIALVIGGSGGTGQVIAQRLAAAGTAVAITYRNNKEGAEAAAQAARAEGVDVELVQLDVAEPASIQAAVAKLVATYGHMHSVVVATGYDIKMRMIHEVTPEEWRDVVNNDVNGFFNIIHATLPHLREKGGSYVHIGSAGVVRWPERDVLSVAPKGAIQQLMKGIAREEGGNGVRANSIAIGVIDAGIFHRLKDTAFDADWHKAVQATIALHRYGAPEEVADTAVFLASARAGYVTGQTISCDGGWNL
ncbi:SDR family oxidoreductase [Sphingobium sp. WCS2017Hpa-17]|uniref:SDR family NAD(P)-dependent oxidoreductase n=1 Tax=Sphingobium sp. WCS2017Hpa-17 TaxID=3073638 RepID=UPI00288C2682|nr:SDR family oxidoreductase [Sphingobium sp. WCS2017Hpa-17]